MTAREALAELPGFFASNPTLEAATVAQAANGDGGPEARTLNLAGDAEAFFRGVIKSAVIDRVADFSLKKLDPTYKPDAGQVEWNKLDEVDAVELAVSRYANLAPLTQFDGSDESYKKRLKYWVTVLTSGDKKAFFFRAFSAASELKRKRGAALVARDGTFHRVDDHVFLFDESIDCVVFGGYLFVLRKHDYRRIFDQLEQLRRRARAAAKALHDQVPIKNFDEFADACGTQAAMADKILAIKKRDYFGELTVDMLQPVMEEFHLGIPIEDVDGQPHLVFRREAEHRFRILKLVDDDYLRSVMTQHRYEVNSKTDPPAP